MHMPEQGPGDPFDFDHVDPAPAAEKRAAREVGWVGIAGLACVIVVALAIEAGLAYALSRGLGILSWPKAEGVILRSEVEEGLLENEVRTRYRYRVGGRDHESEKRGTWGGKFRRASEADDVADRYPAGAAVGVMYNPDDPEEAYLEAGIGVVQCFAFIPPLVIASVAAWLIRSNLRARNAGKGATPSAAPPS